MPNPRLNTNPEVRHWTLLAYMAGDNDLSESGQKDIQEMCEAGASEKVHVGVEIDTKGEHTGSIRNEISKPDWLGVAHKVEVERLNEQNTGDPETLKNFLTWGLKRFPAPNRALVIGGHGSGFRSSWRGIASDSSADDSLNMPEIESACKQAFEEVNKWIGELNSERGIEIPEIHRLQIFGLDACSMNTIEVIHHLSDFAEIIVGSQQEVPKPGWPYDKVLERAKVEEDPTDLALGIVTEYMKYYKERCFSNVTHSAIRTEKIDDVVELISELGSKLVDFLNKKRVTNRRKIRAIRIKVQSFDSPNYVDLIHLSKLIIDSEIDDPDIKTLAAKIEKAAPSCVINNAEEGIHGPGVQNANGISIWFPDIYAAYKFNRTRYLQLKCNTPNPSGWANFLAEYNTRR